MIFPQSVTIDRARRLATWRPRGVLQAESLREIHACVEAEEAAAPEPFDRFTDLSGVEGIQVSFPDIEELAHNRIESYHGRRVKSAIFAPSQLAFGVARMYEQLMRRSPIDVGVFSRLESAAAWLGLPMESLTAELT